MVLSRRKVFVFHYIQSRLEKREANNANSDICLFAVMEDVEKGGQGREGGEGGVEKVERREEDSSWASCGCYDITVSTFKFIHENLLYCNEMNNYLGEE